MGHLIGYARLSTNDQRLDLQIDALTAAGCVRVYSDTASGVHTARPELSRALDRLERGDVLVIWRLDRLGRSLRHLLDVVAGLQERGVGLRSLTEGIDTTTPNGRLILHVFAALAEFERELVRERTRAGLEAARTRGRKGGRPSVMTPSKLAAAKALLQNDEVTIAQAAQAIGVGRTTLVRHLRPSEA